MPPGRTRSPQRAFVWRETFLTALRQDPRVKLACAAAHISRNTVYTHLRKDARFRRQWERALDDGRDLAYQLHLKRLAADPAYQRALERLRLAYGNESWPYLALKNLVS